MSYAYTKLHIQNKVKKVMPNVSLIIISALIIEGMASVYLASKIFHVAKKVSNLDENKDNLIVHIASVLDGHSRATERQTKATDDLVAIMRDVKQVLHDKNGQ